MKRKRQINLLLRQQKKKIKEDKHRRYVSIYNKKLEQNKEFSALAIQMMEERIPGFAMLFDSTHCDHVSELVDQTMAHTEAYKEVYG